jgi:hypothetical protein
MDLYGALRHLALYGPARNEREADELLSAIDEAAGKVAPKAKAETGLADLIKKES